MNTPENITELKDKEIFVFGSNVAGNHAGGAAKLAKEKFGAEEGIGEGLTGKCYAFPTLDGFGPRNRTELFDSSLKLFATAQALPEYIFFLTKVGCGIAGFTEKEIAPIFKYAPNNIIKPINW